MPALHWPAPGFVPSDLGLWLARSITSGQALAGLLSLYHLVLAPAGLLSHVPRRSGRPAGPPAAAPGCGRAPARFAVIVPAHDEEAVIGPLLDSLARLDYPPDRYTAFVVADNCSDGTAAVARAMGATVLERRDPHRRGKPFAVQFALDRVLADRRYDAVVIVDADNLVAPGFLRAMDARLRAGEQVIQGYLDVKNPDDTWVTACFAMNYWVSNRFWSLAKHNLGLAVSLGGTGMCIAADALRRVGWGTATLTEDLEFTVRALLSGIRTTWAHEAVVYDEKPLTLRQSWRQRLRWVQGTTQVALRYLPALVREAFRRRDPALVDAVVTVSRPLCVLLATVLTLLPAILAGLLGIRLPPNPGLPAEVLLVAAGLQYALPLAALALDGVPRRPYRFLPLGPLFAWTWLPLTCQAVLTARRQLWVPTRHGRAISYGQLVAQRGGGRP